MHSTWAVPKWREWGILHPVQVAKEAGQAEVERLGEEEGKGLGTVWTIETSTEGRQGGEDQMICSFTDGYLLSQAQALE